jgi:hypothetical protein
VTYFCIVAEDLEVAAPSDQGREVQDAGVAARAEADLDAVLTEDPRRRWHGTCACFRVVP